MIPGTVVGIFFGNGAGVFSRVWVSTASGEFNFDVIDRYEARKFHVGMTIQIMPDPNHPPYGCIPM